MKANKNWKLTIYPSTERKGYVKLIARNIKNPDLVINTLIMAEHVRDFDPDVYWQTGMVK